MHRDLSSLGELIINNGCYLLDLETQNIEDEIDDVGYTGHKFDKTLGLSYMQARYYDPVIGRFYGNDPVDVLGHMSRGNPVHGFGRFTYVNNNPYKYTDPDGEFGLIGFAIGFVADAAVQYATSGEIDIKQSLVSGAVGSVTGGLTSLAKSSLTVGGKVVASQGEKIAAGALITTGSGAAGASGFAVNESLNGNTPSVKDVSINGLMSATGPGKQVGNAVGKVAEFAKDTFSSLDNQASDVAIQATSDIAGKAVDEAIKRDE